MDLHYLIGADTDHVAKFRRDRPRKLLRSYGWLKID